MNAFIRSILHTKAGNKALGVLVHFNRLRLASTAVLRVACFSLVSFGFLHEMKARIFRSNRRH